MNRPLLQEAQVRLAGVTRVYPGAGGQPPVHALGPIDLDLRHGEFFSVVGPSGCGKSTLLEVIAGLQEPSAGTVLFEGGPVHREVPEGVGVVFQEDASFPWLTVWDNAAYGLRMRKAPARQIKEVVGHFLDKTGLTRFAQCYPHQLSGGMRQRVSIARAFANDPETLLMDEPFSALDEQNKTILQQELLRIWEEDKKTVVFITHSVDEAVTLGDKIMVMTAQPGRAKTIIDVPLERPRSVLELRNDPRYGQIVYDIWGQLKDEVQRARR